MPRLGANDVPHTAQTDHRVLRKPSTQPVLDGPTGLPEFYDNADERLPRFAIDYARGLWLADHAEKRLDRELAQRALLLLSIVDKQCSNDVRIIDALGRAAATQRKLDDALNHWKRSLAIEPDRELTLEKVVLVLHATGRGQEARPYLERLLKLNPWKSSLWGRYAMILGEAKDWNAAIAAAKKAQELDPSVPQIYRFLSEAFQKVGDTEQSERYRELFEKIHRVRE
jgi:tetratricopeptide (TPR) repeat protein